MTNIIPEDKMQYLKKVIRDWDFQHIRNTCLTTCVYNILQDVSKNKSNLRKISYSFPTVCKFLDYNMNRGTQWLRMPDLLSKQLKEDKIDQWIVMENRIEKDEVGSICSKIESDYCSYPILSLAAEYLINEYDIEMQGDPILWSDHCVIALECTDNDCIIFDPYAPFFNVENNPVKVLTRDQLRLYWSTTLKSCKMLWLEKLYRPLEGFDEGK